MAVVSIATLKSYFQTGDFPTEDQFVDLIDTLAALPDVSAGTYTPDLTAVANITATTAQVCQYLRVGNTVTVSGGFTATLTAASATTIYISLPPGLIPDTFTNFSQLGGTGYFTSGLDGIGIVANNTGGGVAIADARWFSSITGSRNYTFSFTYVIP